MVTNSRLDAVVIGAGPAGETVASRLAERGMTVALAERELVGGECAYWACIPSKTLLRPPEVRAEAGRVAGTSAPAQRFEEIAAYRDYMVRNLDDREQVESYERDGIRVHRGAARLDGRGRVIVGEAELETERVILATGSETQVPPIPGLTEAGYWTNRDATTISEVPESAIVLGGGPVGIELAQMLRRFGATVHVVESAPRLISREDPRVGELIESALREDGIQLHLGKELARLGTSDGDRVAHLDGGGQIEARELIVATGRVPRTDGLGLATVGIAADADAIEIDRRCRAADGVWAVGDVTGVMPFTHVAKYQARVACADIAGEEVSADYAAIPRVVFSDPEIAAVGLTAEQARDRGIDVAGARVELGSAIARPLTYERDGRGELCVLADRERRVLVGAWAVAPLAGEWIHYAALAIKARIPIEVLRDGVPQFPTYSEAYLKAFERLEV